MTLHSGNPLYEEGLGTRFTLASSKLSQDENASRETKLLYQPLIQNTRIKDIKQPSVYQPLANKPKNMETIKEQSESPRNGFNHQIHDNKMHQAKSNLLATQNKPYKATTPPKVQNLFYYYFFFLSIPLIKDCFSQGFICCF